MTDRNCSRGFDVGGFVAVRANAGGRYYRHHRHVTTPSTTIPGQLSS